MKLDWPADAADIVPNDTKAGGVVSERTRADHSEFIMVYSIRK